MTVGIDESYMPHPEGHNASGQIYKPPDRTFILTNDEETLMLLTAAYRFGLMDQRCGTVPDSHTKYSDRVWELMRVFEKDKKEPK